MTADEQHTAVKRFAEKQDGCGDEKNDMMKNRNLKIVFVLLLCVTIITSCGQRSSDDVNTDLLIGEWKCEDHPLKNEEYYTGFIMMHVQKDGSFRMTDAEAGNPVISGDLKVLSDKELVLKCSTEEDFDPPPTWQSMNEEQEIAYSLMEDGKLQMTYKEGEAASTLVFVKQ